MKSNLTLFKLSTHLFIKGPSVVPLKIFNIHGILYSGENDLQIIEMFFTLRSGSLKYT